MSRLAIGAGLMVWLGASLVLSRWQRLSRPNLLERLRPYSPSRPRELGRSLRTVAGPLARSYGDRLARFLGVSEPPALRLRRIHSTLDQTGFRVRQLAASIAALIVGALIAATGIPAPMAVLLVAGSPLLGFLAVEQWLAQASQRWQESLTREVPVVSEQLAMLLNSGWSVGSALAEVARRGRGTVAQDLSVVVNRIRQGVSEEDALREWADVARVEAVHRLVGALALNRFASDLGRVLSSEARQARKDLHRRNVETMERRAQQVWVPVTVATLVPGVVLLAVPFLDALRLFANV